MIKTITTIKFTDNSIDKIKFDELVFSYEKNGKMIFRDRVWLPFEVGKKSSLKGLKLCVHKSTRNKYFMVQYWFERKTKMLSLGKYVPGIFGTKQCEEKLFSIVKDHTNEKGVWIKDPVITERDKTRVITAVKDSYFGHYSSKLKIFVSTWSSVIFF